MNDILKKIGEIGIIPVIKIEDASKAVPLAEALSRGGLPAAEVTFRTTAAADAIHAITEAMPDMLVGAGTVLTIEAVGSRRGSRREIHRFPRLQSENCKILHRKRHSGLPRLLRPAVKWSRRWSWDSTLSSSSLPRPAGGLPVIKAVSAALWKSEVSCRPAASMRKTSSPISNSQRFSPAAEASW